MDKPLTNIRTPRRPGHEIYVTFGSGRRISLSRGLSEMAGIVDGMRFSVSIPKPNLMRLTEVAKGELAEADVLLIDNNNHGYFQFNCPSLFERLKIANGDSDARAFRAKDTNVLQIEFAYKETQ